MAKDRRKFYRNVFVVEVLTEEPIASCPELATVAYQITDGDWSGETTHQVENQRVSGRRMAKLLIAQGSDPGFFQLTPEGKNMDEEEG